MINTVIRFFQEDGWPYDQPEGTPFIRLHFQGNNGQWTCLAQVREEQAQFLFYSVCPFKAPEDTRLAVAEFLTRANNGLVLGNFELDFSDGAIRFKTSIGVEGDQLSTALVEQVVRPNVFMMDRYLPGIMQVIYNHTPPAEAIAAIEK